MLRATTACTFSTSQLPKVVRAWCGLHILTFKCASRHNGVQFFISHLPRRLRTRRFSKPIFRPSGATNHWKITMFCDFATFSRVCIFCLLTWLFLFSDSLIFFLLFSSLTLPTSAFSSVHIVGSLTSKHPLIRQYFLGIFPGIKLLHRPYTHIICVYLYIYIYISYLIYI